MFDPFASNKTDTRNGPKKVFLTASRTASAGRHFRSADENRRVAQVVWPACEKRAVNQLANDFRRHAAVAKKLIHTRVNGHDPIEDAGLWISVKLNQDRRFGTGHSPRQASAEDDPGPEHHLANGCSTLSLLAVISAMGGSFFMARSMASLVAS